MRNFTIQYLFFTFVKKATGGYHMTITDIALEIKKTEELIFINSLYKNLTLNQLADTYLNLICLKNQFLSSSFSEIPLEERMIFVLN